MSERVGARDEVTVEAGGEAFTFLWTNRALAEAERAMNKSLLQIRSTGDLRFDDVAALLRAGLTAARREQGLAKAATPDEAWHAMDLMGFTRAVAIAGEGLVAVLAYEPTEDANPPA